MNMILYLMWHIFSECILTHFYYPFIIEVFRGPEEMNAMDRILRTNGRLGSPRARGLSFREGDIASSYNIQSRSAITCPGNSCLWPKSVDGSVYVPYIISPQYGKCIR
ncbi:unnamed protein product [Oncorhynchus mykiss]|uniref:Uncharacterized protein n=1 Tax=Oncorhynchus mykiss TaxID=8022 RepID=A0A060Z722_ONCMY|nr:unnamed protein product [Oncorhynchus mykiss]